MRSLFLSLKSPNRTVLHHNCLPRSQRLPGAGAFSEQKTAFLCWQTPDTAILPAGWANRQCSTLHTAHRRHWVVQVPLDARHTSL